MFFVVIPSNNVTRKPDLDGRRQKTAGKHDRQRNRDWRRIVRVENIHNPDRHEIQILHIGDRVSAAAAVAMWKD